MAAMNAFKRDLAILRGLPSWRRTLTLLAYVLVGSTVASSIVLALVDHVATDELLLVDVVMFGAAIAASIVARGFHPVPKPRADRRGVAVRGRGSDHCGACSLAQEIHHFDMTSRATPGVA